MTPYPTLPYPAICIFEFLKIFLGMSKEIIILYTFMLILIIIFIVFWGFCLFFGCFFNVDIFSVGTEDAVT